MFYNCRSFFFKNFILYFCLYNETNNFSKSISNFCTNLKINWKNLICIDYKYKKEKYLQNIKERKEKYYLIKELYIKCFKKANDNVLYYLDNDSILLKNLKILFELYEKFINNIKGVENSIDYILHNEKIKKELKTHISAINIFEKEILKTLDMYEKFEITFNKNFNKYQKKINKIQNKINSHVNNIVAHQNAINDSLKDICKINIKGNDSINGKFINFFLDKNFIKDISNFYDSQNDLVKTFMSIWKKYQFPIPYSLLSDNFEVVLLDVVNDIDTKYYSYISNLDFILKYINSLRNEINEKIMQSVYVIEDLYSILEKHPKMQDFLKQEIDEMYKKYDLVFKRYYSYNTLRDFLTNTQNQFRIILNNLDNSEEEFSCRKYSINTSNIFDLEESNENTFSYSDNSYDDNKYELKAIKQKNIN